MKTVKLMLGLLICAMATAASAQNIISNFATQSLEIDLPRYPFGTALDNRFQPVTDGFRTTTNHVTLGTNIFALTNGSRPYFLVPPLGAGSSYEWYQTTESANYSRRFPARDLSYGFVFGKLAAIRVRLRSGGQAELRTDMARVQDGFYSVSREAKAAGLTNGLAQSVRPGETKPVDDGQFLLRYMAMCGPNFDSLIESAVQITPPSEPK
jgi:hypothetical protein